jgi:pentatricopeptide repeat protein
MEHVSNKNAAEALSLYSDVIHSSEHRLPIQALLRYSNHTGQEFYSALVQCAVREGQPERVEQLLDDMKGAQIERTLAFYESVMKVLAGKKHYQEALAVYNRLHSEGLKASPVTLSCLINFTAELGDYDSAIWFFEELSSTSTPSIRAYMVVLRVYSKRQDWTKSLEIFRDMQARDVAIDSLILNAVLATGAAVGKTEAAEALLHDVAESKKEIIDIISYNTVLKGYAHQKMGEKSRKLFDCMLARGAKPNGITFNTVMDALVRGGHLTDAWDVLDQMQQADIRPDKYTCTILMKGLHEDSTPKQLSKVIDLIQSALPQCDSALCTSLFRSLIQVAARLSNTALLMRAFTQMMAQSAVPTANDFQLLIQTLAHQGETAHCSTVWGHALNPASTRGGSQKQPATAATLAVFTSVMEELAKKDQVEGMMCAFESLRSVATVGVPRSPEVSQKSFESAMLLLLEQCRTALLQAASRKQHSSPALRRLLELAPQHLPPTTLQKC